MNRKQSFQFEWPVPDVSMIGDYRRGTCSNRDRAAINRTLPPEINREKLWANLEPLIRETRSVKQIINMLETKILALESSKQVVTGCGDSATGQSLNEHIIRLWQACCYYKNVSGRSRNWERLKKFCIARAWLEAGGRLTISSPDDPNRVKGDRRGRGTPSGPLVNYFLVASQIICKKPVKAEGVKAFLYRRYKKHSHFQSAKASFSGSSGLKASKA